MGYELWHSGLKHQCVLPHPISKCQFELWLPYLQSIFVLIHPGREAANDGPVIGLLMLVWET